MPNRADTCHRFGSPIFLKLPLLVAVVILVVGNDCGPGQPNNQCSSTLGTDRKFHACSFCGHDSVAVLLGSTLSLEECTGPQHLRKQVSLRNPMPVETAPSPLKTHTARYLTTWVCCQTSHHVLLCPRTTSSRAEIAVRAHPEAVADQNT